MSIDINCDMGESFGPWKMGADDDVMPNITSANVACGAHAGDPRVMRRTVRAAKLPEPTRDSVTSRSGGTLAAALGEIVGKTPASTAPASASRSVTCPEPRPVSVACRSRTEARNIGPNA